MIGRAVVELSWHQKKSDAARAARRAFRTRQQHHDFGVGVRAEPLLAGEPPVIAFLHGGRCQLADIGAAFLLRHELPALRELAHVGLRQSVEIFCLQRGVAESRQQLGAAIGDVDRAAQPELGLVEQKRKGMLRHHRIGLRPAQNALAQRHRMDAELAERGALEFAIGRMIFDTSARRGQSGRADAVPAGGGRRDARIRRDDPRRDRPDDPDAARCAGTIRRTDGCAASRSTPDRRDRNSCRSYPARSCSQPRFPLRSRFWRSRRFLVLSARKHMLPIMRLLELSTGE